MSQTVLAGNLLDTKPQINLIPNGGFELWSNGVAFNGVTVNNTNFADGWINNSAGNTINVNRESTEIDTGAGKYSMKVEIVTPSGVNCKVLNTHNRTDLVGRTINVTARVKTTIANGIRIELSDGTGGSYSAYHTGSGNWETLTTSFLFTSGMSVLHVAVGFAAGASVVTGIYYMDSVMVTATSKGAVFATEDPELDKVKAGAVSVLQGNAQNLLTNGGFERWDTITSFTNESLPPAMVQNFCPGWNMQTGGTGVTWSRESGAGNFDTGIYSLKVVSTSPSWYAGQTLTGELRKPFLGQTITFSARIKTTQASKIRIGLGDSATANSYSAYHSGSGNWETLTITKSIASNTTYVGIMFGFLGDSGVASTVYVDSCMLVWASVPAPFSAVDNEIDRLRGGAAYDMLLNQSNLVINGGFEVWQRGTSFANLANGAYGPDIWRMIKDGADTTGVVQITTAGNFDSGQRSARVDITHSTSTYVRLENATRIADGAAAAIKNKTFTLTARVATTLANIRIGIYAGAGGFTTGLSVHTSAPNSGGGAFETMTVSGTTNSSASDIRIWIGYIVAGETPVTGYFVVDSVMMVYGSTPVVFVPEDTSVELVKCQRWFQIHGGSVTNDEIAQGFSYSTSACEFGLRWGIPMVTVPTITVIGGNSFVVYNNAYSTISTLTVTADAPHPLGCRLRCTSGGTMTLGQGNSLRSQGAQYIMAEV